jgi:organic radical activating enzyme
LLDKETSGYIAYSDSKTYYLTYNGDNVSEATPIADSKLEIIAVRNNYIYVKDGTDIKRINIYNLKTIMDKTQETVISLENLQTYDYDIDDYDDGIQPQFQFKFVYTNEDSVKEIKTLLREIEKEVDLEEGYLNKCVLLMPEGVNNEQLDNISQECVEVCMREGWRFCDRLHIRVWGDKRGV